MQCRDTMAGFMIFILVLDLRGFKTEILLMKCFQIAHGSLMKADIQWKLCGNHILKFHKNLKKCGMLRRWCFIAPQNFKLKNIMRCEQGKRKIPPWIVTLLLGTIQHWFCLFHSSHLLMCFNLKFSMPIKHHPLNIPHFFEFFCNFKTSFSRGFHRFPPNVGFHMISSPLLRARSESCVLTIQNPNPTDRTCLL